MISVLILTKNEAANLPRCLDALLWCDDIVVLDSNSTDNTVQIARRYGARVYFREYDNERAQREASLKLPFKYEWVYNPDADEVTPHELSEEMKEIVQLGSNCTAYRVRFKTMFLGKWIRFCSLYPTWVVRLFKPRAVSFERDINLIYRIEGETGQLKSHFLHLTFANGLTRWFEKHNHYSQKEAEETIASLTHKSLDLRGLFSFGDSVRRRKALKELSFRLPARPLLRFLYMYLCRLGMLDGSAGLHYCTLLAFYEYQIVLKVKELRRRSNGQSI